MEAEFAGARAHVFTDSPKEFIGKLADVVDLPLDSNGNRAIFVGVLNAVLRYLDWTEKTLHCRDEEPEQCAVEIAAFLKCKYHDATVGLVGLNPAIAESLSDAFGAGNVRSRTSTLITWGNRNTALKSGMAGHERRIW